MFTPFYNGSIRRMVVAFGSLFNQIYIDRAESSGTKQMLVPISYAPKEKYKVRLAGDPLLQNPNEIVLPRMAFEITGYAYDSMRKRNSTSRFLLRDPNVTSTKGVDYTFAEVPYNIDFGLYLYVRNMEDGLRVVEQILPQFSPEFVVTVNFDDVNRKVDVPIFLNSVSSEEDYEGDFTTRRSIIFTLNFTMKTYLFGNKRNYSEIRTVQASLLDGRVFDEDAPAGLTFDPDGINTEFAKVIVGISGPSGASSGIANYDAYARLQELQTGGSVFYHQDMASGGITTDWLSRSAERFGGSEVVGTISLASELPQRATVSVYSPINNRVYVSLLADSQFGIVGATCSVAVINPSTNTVDQVIRNISGVIRGFAYNTANNKIYCYSSQAASLNGGYFDVLVLDPLTNTFTQTINLSKTTALLPGVTLSGSFGNVALYVPTNNCLYLQTTQFPTNTGLTGAVYRVDCTTNTVAENPVLVPWNSLGALEYCPLNNTIYSTVGGIQGGESPKVDLIDPTTNTVTQTISIGIFDPQQTLQTRIAARGIIYCPRTEKLYITIDTRSSSTDPYVMEIVSIDPKNNNRLQFIGYTSSIGPSAQRGGISYNTRNKKIYINGAVLNLGAVSGVHIVDPETDTILDPVLITPSNTTSQGMVYCPSNGQLYASSNQGSAVSFIAVIS